MLAQMQGGLLFLALACAGKTDSIRRRLDGMFDNFTVSAPMKQLDEQIYGDDAFRAGVPQPSYNEETSELCKETSSWLERFNFNTDNKVVKFTNWYNLAGLTSCVIAMACFAGNSAHSPQSLMVVFLIFLTLFASGMLLNNCQGKGHAFTVGVTFVGVAITFGVWNLPSTNGIINHDGWASSSNGALTLSILVLAPMLTVFLLIMLRNSEGCAKPSDHSSNLFIKNFVLITATCAVLSAGFGGGIANWALFADPMSGVYFGISLATLLSLTTFLLCLMQKVDTSLGSADAFFTGNFQKAGITTFSTASIFFLSALPWFGWGTFGYGLGAVLICFIPVFFMFRGNCVSATANGQNTLKMASFYKVATFAITSVCMSGFAFNLADQTLMLGSLPVWGACLITLGLLALVLTGVGLCRTGNTIWEKCFFA